ncbi:MAG: biopolymer transporter ExbD [Lentisphaeria bacterium]|nr:biopolymer transporter ExbD [Lentisphaeria bacterium]
MNFKRNIQERSAGFQMAPMIDIVFILLIHFMAATVFAQWEKKVDITVPTASTATEQQRQAGELILNVDSEGRLYINSQPYSDETALELLKQIAGAFQDQPIILRADKETNVQQLLHVMDLCREADVWNIALATVTPQE